METTSILKPPISKVLKSGQVILQSGEEVGEHMTTKREEIIIVLEGTATILEGSKESIITTGNTHFIPEGIVHNVCNKHQNVLRYIYVVSLFA